MLRPKSNRLLLFIVIIWLWSSGALNANENIPFEIFQNSGFQLIPIKCRGPLGMENKSIPNSQISASSIWDADHGADRSRLNTLRQGSKRGAWSARHNDAGQWIEVDFPQAAKISGIATQGRQDLDQWVKSYRLQYSLNGHFFEDYNGGVTFFGNTDRNTIVGHVLEPAIVAKAIRILPVSWHYHISMRIELYGCIKGFPPANRLKCAKDLLPNLQLSSSSQWDKNHGPANGKLYYQPERVNVGAWSSLLNDGNQWLQADLGQISRITIISTQGRADLAQWVKSYSVSYSIFGYAFQNLKDGTSTKVFSGNSDQHTVVSHKLASPIIARYMRFRPETWHNHISMRAGLFGCTKGFDIPNKNKCGLSLGLESGIVTDSQMSASSEWDKGHRAANARLHFVAGSGRSGAWSTRTNDKNQWLQMDFEKIVRVIKCATQGRSDMDQWVTKYTLSYSRDGTFWSNYKRELEGNKDRSTVVTHVLIPTFYARFVRVQPTAWHSHISMRVEVYGCRTGFTVPLVRCAKALGMENKQIPDFRVSVSSLWDANHGADRSRLNTLRQGSKRGAWSARHNNAGQWIEVDFPQAAKISGIATQGRQDLDQWVKSYKLQYSLNGHFFEDYNGGVTLFGNTDRNTIVGHILEPAIVAKAIRILPVSWHGHISMRLELYGCKKKWYYLPLRQQ